MTHLPLRDRGLLVVAVVLVGLNLRGSIIGVSPILDDIQRDLHISAGAAGLLTSIPVFCFAAVSPVVAVVARRLGVDAAVAISLVVLAVGVAIRPWSGFPLMLGGTILIGAAIAVGNVLLPVIARRDFPERPGPLLSAITTALLVSATISAVLAVPLESVMGWRAATAIWSVPAILALVMWLAGTGMTKRPVRSDQPDRGAASTTPTPQRHHDRDTSPWRRLSAWEIGVFFGLQSLLFYAATAWLPTMLTDEGGLDSTDAGTALSIFQLLGIAGAVAVPVLMRRKEVRYGMAATLGLLWVVFFGGLLVAPAAWPLWCALGGTTQGGCLALGLSLIAVRSSSSDAARRVSAMVQTVAYLMGAAGPILIGGVSVAATGWTLPFVLLIGLSVVCGVFAFRAASPKFVV